MNPADLVCVECLGESQSWLLLNHPSGLCQDCYDEFKQRLRDGEVQGVE